MSSVGQVKLDVMNPQGAAFEAQVDSRHLKRRRRLRSRTKPRPPRPSRTELERACRIALMEEGRPAPIEIIYDRILHRGSVTFFGYKRPFRALASAMSTLEKKGEVSLMLEAGTASMLRRGCQRLWQLSVPIAASARISTSSLAEREGTSWSFAMSASPCKTTYR
jgi:hypothetical protein